MTNEPSTVGGPGGPVAGPRAISLDEAAEIATEVRELIAAGEEHSASERLRRVHPADMGIIVAGLPHASRDTMLRVMSPETVAWMLRQMNPIEAGRVSTRIGARVLALCSGNSIRGRRSACFAGCRRALAAMLPRQPAAETTPLEHPPDTAGSLMVGRFPSVAIGDGAESARARLRALGEDRRLFTLVFVVDGAHLAGQIAMVDLALAEPDTPVRVLTTPVVANRHGRHARRGVRATVAPLQPHAAPGCR